MNKIILYIATSEDGFIADKKGGVDWLPHPKNDQDLETVGYNRLMEGIDTIFMGRKSFQQIIGFGEWGWPDKQTYVFSSKVLDTPLPCISVTKDFPRQLVQTIKDRGSKKDIWLLGGSELVQSFSQDKLIDEIILTIVPQTLGEGIPLGLDLNRFDVINEKPLMDGMIQKIYLKSSVS